MSETRRDYLEAAREHVSSALDHKHGSVVGETTERIIAGLSRAAHGGQQITFTKYDNAEDMITVENPHSGKIEFGTSPGGHGVDVFVYTPESDDACAAMTVSTPSWDDVCAHLVETNLHPEWSYAQQFAFGSPNVTMHKPRGMIFKQVYNGKGRLANIRFKFAQMLKRPIYTALELTDGSTVWERWG